MINGDHQGPATLGGKNVYLVTPPNKKQPVSEYHYSTPNPNNINTSTAAPENLSQKHLQTSSTTNSELAKPARYRINEDGQLKNSGTYQ